MDIIECQRDKHQELRTLNNSSGSSLYSIYLFPLLSHLQESLAVVAR